MARKAVICSALADLCRIGLVEARKILPKDAIVGISVSTVEEAKLATQQGADYVGIGTLFTTPT